MMVASRTLSGTRKLIPQLGKHLLLRSADTFETPREAGRWHYLCAFDQGGKMLAASPRVDPVHFQGLPIGSVFAEPMRQFVEAKRSLPLSYIQLGPTNRCNIECMDCLSSLVRVNATLDWDTVKSVMRDLPAVARLDETKTAVLGWSGPGEPAVTAATRRLILKTSRLSAEQGIVSRMITNGIFNDLGFIEGMVRDGNLGLLWVSMKTGDRELYHRHTGRNSFDQVLRNMEAIASAREKFGMQDCLVLKASVEISTLDPLGFVAAAKIAREMGFDVFKPALHVPTFAQAFQANEPAILEGRANLATMLSQDFLPLYWKIPEQDEPNSKEGRITPARCFHAMTRLFVDGEARAWPCFVWSDESQLGYPFGDLREVSLAEMWNQSQRVDFNRKNSPQASRHCQTCHIGGYSHFFEWFYEVFTDHPETAFFMRGFDVEVA